MRQADVAVRADVAQQTVSDLECGHFGGMSLDDYCRLAEVLDADVALAPRWRGPKLDRLLDRRHAALQNQVSGLLAAQGWEVRAEWSFNHYGDRGSVDILGWRPDREALLIVEIKTEIASLEETLRALDVKRRVVPILSRMQNRRSPRAVATVLVLPATSTHRELVARHEALVSASLPSRSCAVRSWVELPDGDMRGVWFVRNTGGGGAMRKVSGVRRVGVPRGTEPTPPSRSNRVVGGASGTSRGSRHRREGPEPRA